MDKLRIPFFVGALVVAGLVVLVEVGSPLLLKAKASTQELQAELGKPQYADLNKGQLQELNAEAPPGLGLPSLAFLDGLMAFTAVLMGLPFLLSDRLQGRLVGPHCDRDIWRSPAAWWTWRLWLAWRNSQTSSVQAWMRR